jgi:hypothetical protein
MRKIWLIVLFTSVSAITFGQSKLGLKFSPSISSTRSSLVDTLYDVEPESSSFKFSIGLIYDHELTETYFLSTGLIFVPKQVSFTASPEVDQPTAKAFDEPTQEYRLNYLQIPVSLKLFTNEIQPDMKVFFQVGVAPEIQIFSEPVEEEYDLIDEFKPLDLSILFGAGVEYRAGVNTTLFGSITYQRALLNTINKIEYKFQEELYLRSTVVSLDLGIKF